MLVWFGGRCRHRGCGLCLSALSRELSVHYTSEFWNRRGLWGSLLSAKPGSCTL